ncbi:MAG: sugar ABC transporter substrate-binding protein [Halanaerobiaceae bacterium]
MKKALMLILSLTLVFGLMISVENTEEAQAQEKYDVAYIARAQSDSFAAWLANSIEEEAENYENIELEIFDGQADSERQNSLIENAIVNQFDAVIIQPHDVEAQKPYAEQVITANVPLITTNPRIEDLEGSSSVDADPYKQAEVVAEKAVEEVPEDAKVVVLEGPSGNLHATERRVAWDEVFFDERSDVEIVGEQIANWNKSEAMNYMEDWVQSNDSIDAIISMNDNMAAGALEVVKDDEEFEDIQAYGVDGTAEALTLIEEGKMTATCFQNAYELGEKNLEVVDKLLEGEEEIHTDIDTPLITRDNVDEYMEVHEEAGNL